VENESNQQLDFFSNVAGQESQEKVSKKIGKSGKSQ